MKTITKAIFLCILYTYVMQIQAQISPPGLGRAHIAEWSAIGLKQDIGSKTGAKWQSTTYLGLGRKSSPINYNPFYHSAIWVINQEFQHAPISTFQYSFALSYRHQDLYSEEYPYLKDSVSFKQEWRMYGRLYYHFNIKKIRLTPILRQEFRTFLTPKFRPFTDFLQFRTRIRLQLNIALDPNKRHQININSEQLFSMDKGFSTKKWSTFAYDESRFSIFYTHQFKDAPLNVSIGYMNNLVGTSKPYTVHYLCVDLTLNNPFKKHK